MSRVSAEDHEQIWVLLEGGETPTDIGRAIGRSITTVRSFVLRHGGASLSGADGVVGQADVPDRPGEISRGLALDESFSTIACRIVALLRQSLGR